MTRLVSCLAVAALFATACSQSGPQPASNAPESANTQSPAGAPAPVGAPPSSAVTPGEPAAPAGSAAPVTEGSPAPVASGASSLAAAAPAAPAAPPAPTVREVSVPAGTSLSVRLTTAVASDTSKVEDTVRGTLTRAVTIGDTVAVPAGAEVVGSVVEAEGSGRVKGRARIAFRFNRLLISEEGHEIRTATIAREADASTKGDVKKGGIGAGAGAIVGGIVGGGKGAAIGAGVGGAGAVMATKGEEVRLAAGDTVTATLQNDVTVLVPVR